MGQKKNWVDYKEIKESISIIAVLDKYGIELKQSGENHTSCCPIHKGSNSRQFSVNLEKSIWNCFGDCNTGGNIIDFVAMMEFGNKEPSSIRKAALKLKEWFINEPESEESIETENEEDVAEEKGIDEPEVVQEEIINKPLSFELKNLDQDHEWFKKEGILPETVQYFGLGLQSKGKTIPNRIAIPIHNQLGQLIAYCGCAVDKDQVLKEGKYKLPENFIKSEVVYNLHRQQKSC